MDLRDRVAIVTGASAGVGAAIVKVLLSLGMKVVGFARRKERIENLVKKHNGKLFALGVDVTKPQEMLDGFDWVTKHVGPVCVLVNNAGVSPYSSVVTGDLETWQKVMDTNYMSVAVACQKAIQIMKEHNVDGYIINISSVFGYYDLGNPKMVMYSASKSALRTMTENIRTELARMGSRIRISTLGPGIIKTEIVGTAAGSTEIAERFYENVPHLSPEDIANTIGYLLSTPPHVHITELLIRPTGEDMKQLSQQL